jgi:Mrp family chromosome partitioning ATPase
VERIHQAHEITRLQRPGGVPHLVREAVEGPVGAELVRARLPDSRVSIDRSLFNDRPIVMPDDAGPAAHAYRMLRTQLLHRVRQHRIRTVGIVSAADREGKTLTAVNLALSLAVEPNQSVMLVDLDLHRPSVASTLKLRVEAGLESWFAGRVGSLDEITFAVDGFERLSLLPTVSAVPGSSEALASARAQAMLTELKASKPECLILFDLSPLLLADDFLTIAAHLDGVVIVAREGRTRREDLARMSEILGSVRLLGTVLNHSSQFEKRAY